MTRRPEPREKAESVLGDPVGGSSAIGAVPRRIRGVGWAVLDLADAMREIADAIREVRVARRRPTPYGRRR